MTTDRLDDDATEVGVTAGGTGRDRRQATAPPLPEIGDRLGHFVVEGVLGVGGMGVVLRAHDERLDRSVALKLVRPSVHATEGTRGTERLLIEARAMAKISDPNVITVHEVGVVEGQVFLAMEFIEGQTLGEWVAAGRRSWVKIVRQWMAAGQGLIAAHRAGLVHRDFKPDNVLVSRDGRILVTDFGIAGDDGDDGDSLEASDVAGPQRPLTDEADLSRQVSRLTETGGLLGTPRYMAPEQFDRRRVDARADQFAFCVSLWEAVYARHPFDSSSLAALALAASTGALREPPRGHRVPDSLRRILTRGLATAPDDRYPDVAALLRDIGRFLRRRARLRRLIPVALVAPTVGLAVWATWPNPVDPCAGDEQRWVGVWDDEVSAEVGAAMAAAEHPYIGESAAVVRTTLDAYVHSWDAHERRACTDTRVRESVSELMLDRRMSCLDSRQRRLVAVVEPLRAGDPEIMAKAVELVTQLPALDDCDALTSLAADAPMPAPTQREVLAEFDRDLAKARTLDIAGRSEAAGDLLEGWVPRLAELGYPRAEAQNLYRLAGTYDSRDGPKSCDLRRQAYVEAVEAGASKLAASIALSLAGCRPKDSADDRSEFWLAVAASGYNRLERPLDFLYYTGAGSAYHQLRDFERALVALETALSLADDKVQVRKVATTEGNVGAMHASLRNLDEAEAFLRAAIERGAYGEHHPVTLSWQTNIVALKMMRREDPEVVLREAGEVLAAQDAGLGPGSGPSAVTLTVMGVAARQLDRIADATEYDARAYEIRRRVEGSSHWLTIESLEKLARDHILAGQHDSGVEELRQVIELLEQQHGPGHVEIGKAWTNLGWGLRTAGRLDEAADAHRKAIELIVAANPDDPLLFESYAQLGRTLVLATQHAEAVDPLERALALCDDDTPAPDLAQIKLDLARAYRGRRRKDARAARLAREALTLIEAEAPDASIRAELEAFLSPR